MYVYIRWPALFMMHMMSTIKVGSLESLRFLYICRVYCEFLGDCNVRLRCPATVSKTHRRHQARTRS